MTSRTPGIRGDELAGVSRGERFRMRPVHGIALAVFLAPAIVAAQSSTADGVQALLRGDYEAAARILKPLAENGAQPDPIAQFFLASLYEAGRGVARNQLRACS